MTCKLEIGKSDAYVFVQLSNCREVRSLLFMFPLETPKFYISGHNYGIDLEGDDSQYLIVSNDGYFECISPQLEMDMKIPVEIADQFIEYVKAHEGEPVAEDVAFELSGDPQNAGKRRKTRRKNKNKK